MKFFYVALFVAVQVWMATARPKASPPTTEASALPKFEDIIAQAQDNFKTMSEHVNEILGLPKHADGKDVLDILKNNTESWTKEVSGLVEKLKKQIDTAKTGEVADTIKSVKDKLEKTVESLRKEIESPEVKAKTKQIQENFTKSLNVIVDEANKLSKTIVTDKGLSEDLQKLSKQVVDQAVKAADQLQNSIQEAAKKTDAKH